MIKMDWAANRVFRVSSARFMKDLLKYATKQSITRILMNMRIEDISLDSLTLDLGSNTNPYPSYYSRIKGLKKDEVITVDIIKEKKPHVLADLEESLPFKDNSVRTVLMFNLFEHIYNHENLSREVYRVLQKDGICYTFVAFFFTIHGSPYDYFRYSGYALRQIFEGVGFNQVEIESIGFGPFTTSWHFLSSLPPIRFLSPLFFTLSFTLDKLISRLSSGGADFIPLKHPLGYFITCRK